MINQIVLAVEHDGSEHDCVVLGQLRRENDKGDMYHLCCEDGRVFQSNYIKKVYPQWSELLSDDEKENNISLVNKFSKFMK